MSYQAEYIWIDGTEPSPLLRSKTRIVEDKKEPGIWGFDGSSTNQATGSDSDCVLSPVFGGVYTYAAPGYAQGTAAGQVCARQLRHLYRVEKLGKSSKIYGVIADPVALEGAIKAVSGVVDHGLYLGMAERALIGTADGEVTLYP